VLLLQEPQYQPLEIQDPKKYFMVPAADTTGTAVKPEPRVHADNDEEEAMQVDCNGILLTSHINAMRTLL
jgi:hypothetical protein